MITEQEIADLNRLLPTIDPTDGARAGRLEWAFRLVDEMNLDAKYTGVNLMYDTNAKRWEASLDTHVMGDEGHYYFAVGDIGSNVQDAICRLYINYKNNKQSV